MIEAKDLLKTYSVGGQELRAVDRASLSIQKGEFISIVGHSGSGKTTLLSLIGGLTRPDAGTVSIAGVDLWSLSDAARSEFRGKTINFIFQFASLVPTLTVLENVLLPAAFTRGGAADAEYAKDLITMVGLSDKLTSYPSQLSGGQQRRVAIARAFVNRPEIILADEPTGDLDEETEAMVMDIFRDMNRKGTTFVIVTHTRELAGHAGRGFRMRHGVLEENERVNQ